ncbi:MAG: hypothetical protein ACE5FU_02805 [Nitrospinota bacterium]
MITEGSNEKEEQKRYARVLDLSAKTGFLGVVLSYMIYLFRILPEKISSDEMQKIWSFGPEYYITVSGAGRESGWLGLVAYSDFLLFVPIIFLSSVTTWCYLSILPVFLKKREFLFAGICFAEILVFVFAAFGGSGFSAH